MDKTYHIRLQLQCDLVYWMVDVYGDRGIQVFLR